MTPEPVAVLGGTGPQGRGLALRLARAGSTVVIGSRDAQRARDIAGELAPGDGLALSGAANADAASSADVVFVAVPWEAHAPTLESLREVLAGRIVVDLVNPLVFDERGPSCLDVPEGSAAEQAQSILPDSHVVAGFHLVSAKHLLGSEPLDTDVILCGDDRDAVARVITLADGLPGVRGVDGGALRLSQFVEGMTAVLLSINRSYRTTTGLHLTHLDVTRKRA